MKKRLLSALLALTMLLTLVPTAAFAEEPGDGIDDPEIVYEIGPRIGSVEDTILLSEFPSFFGITSGAAYSGSYYNQLDANSKKVYDAIYASPLKDGPTTTPVTFSRMSSDAGNTIIFAFAALVNDHPELSWLINTEWYYTSNSLYLSDLGYREATTKPTEPVTAQNSSYADTGDRAAIEAAIDRAKGSIGTLSGKSNYEKVKAIYDWICNNVRYADYRNDPNEKAKFENGWRGYQTPYSALVDGVTVCAGYAKAFKLLCDEYGIPCAYIVGDAGGADLPQEWGAHAWNYVQMEDGKWYGVDCTWGDGSTWIDYDYLLVGSDKLFKTRAEGSLYGEYAFTYPALSKEDYVDPDAPDTIEVSSDPTTTYTYVPSITSLGTPEYKEITFSAVAKDSNGTELSGKTIEWMLNSAHPEVVLRSNEDGTATVSISNSAMQYLDSQGYSVTVTASCGTTSGSQTLLIYAPKRTAKFVQIYKGDTAAVSDTITLGGSTVYTAKVYDQCGMPMDGAQILDPYNRPVNRPTASVTWSVSGGTGVTVNNGTVTVAPDAAEGDYTVTAASGSGKASVTVTVAAAHNFSSEWTGDETDHWHACTDPDCNEVSDKAEHSWNDGEITTQPTYDAAGVKTYTCTVCNQTRTEPVDQLEHHFATAWSKDDTYHWHDCTDPNCNEVSGKAAHSWNDGVITTQPTYDTAGVKTYTCTVCNQTRTEPVDQLEHHFATAWSKDDTYHWHDCTDPNCNEVSGKAAHSWNAGVITTQPTYDAAGVKTYTCTVCQFTRTESVAPVGHNYSKDWSSDKDSHWHACMDVGYTDLKADEAAHTWDDGKVTTEPTYDTAGVKTYTCTVCGYSKTVEIVQPKVTSVTLSDTYLTMQVGGDSITLTATVNPDTVTDRSVTWSSSDESVVTVDENGVLTAVSSGTVVITATSNLDPEKFATCEVTAASVIEAEYVETGLFGAQIQLSGLDESMFYIVQVTKTVQGVGCSMALKIAAPVGGKYEIDVLRLGSGNTYTVEIWVCGYDANTLDPYEPACSPYTVDR